MVAAVSKIMRNQDLILVSKNVKLQPNLEIRLDFQGGYQLGFNPIIPQMMQKEF